MSGIVELDEPDGPVAQAVLQATRLRLLAILSSDEVRERGGLSLQELGDLLACSPQNVHHHVRRLVDAGMVYMARSEATQNVPRQYWCSDVRCIRLHVPMTGLAAALDVELVPEPSAKPGA